MSFLDRVRLSFFPRQDPESWSWRVRLGQGVAGILAAGLGVWILGVAVPLIQGRPPARDIRVDALFLAVLAAGDVLTLVLLRRQAIVPAGYLLASTFLLGLIHLDLTAPQFLGAGFVLAPLGILAAGTLVAEAPGYLFAGLFTGITLWTWLRAQAGPLGPLFPQGQGVALLVSQALLNFGAAGAVHAYLGQLRRVLRELRQQADQLTELALTDEVTSMPNRRQLVEQLDREFRRARRYRRPLSLLYLDLDGFKSINDRFGHLFGDEILRAVATTIRAVLRSTDLLARIGGDEFAVLLPETSTEGAQKVAAKLHKALASYSHHLGPAVTPLSFCAGVSEIGEEDASIDDLLSRADEALYLAKSVQPGSTFTERDLQPRVKPG